MSVRRIAVSAVLGLCFTPISAFAAIVGISGAPQGDPNLQVTPIASGIGIVTSNDPFGGYLTSFTFVIASSSPGSWAVNYAVDAYSDSGCSNHVGQPVSGNTSGDRVVYPGATLVTIPVSPGFDLSATRCLLMSLSNFGGGGTDVATYALNIAPFVPAGNSYTSQYFGVFYNSASSTYAGILTPAQIASVATNWDTTVCTPLTGTTTFPYIGSPFNLRLCMSLVFGYSPDVMTPELLQLRQTASTIWPIGYVTRFVTLVTGTATSSFPSIVIGLPLSVGGYDTSDFHASTTIDVHSSIMAAAGFLDTPIPIPGESWTVSLWSVFMLIWTPFCYLMLFYAIMTDLLHPFGGHKEDV